MSSLGMPPSSRKSSSCSTEPTCEAVSEAIRSCVGKAKKGSNRMGVGGAREVK